MCPGQCGLGKRAHSASGAGGEPCTLFRYSYSWNYGCMSLSLLRDTYLASCPAVDEGAWLQVANTIKCRGMHNKIASGIQVWLFHVTDMQQQQRSLSSRCSIRLQPE